MRLVKVAKKQSYYDLEGNKIWNLGQTQIEKNDELN
jgi:hypothetical protein